MRYRRRPFVSSTQRARCGVRVRDACRVRNAGTGAISRSGARPEGADVTAQRKQSQAQQDREKLRLPIDGVGAGDVERDVGTDVHVVHGADEATWCSERRRLLRQEADKQGRAPPGRPPQCPGPPCVTAAGTTAHLAKSGGERGTLTSSSTCLKSAYAAGHEWNE